MKQIYLKPESIVIELKPSGMLCYSDINNDISGDANSPALVRGIGWDDEESD
jgi:hypothetical protein